MQRPPSSVCTYFDKLMYETRLMIWPRDLRKWLEHDEQYLRSLDLPEDSQIVLPAPVSPEE